MLASSQPTTYIPKPPATITTDDLQSVGCLPAARFPAQSDQQRRLRPVLRSATTVQASRSTVVSRCLPYGGAFVSGATGRTMCKLIALGWGVSWRVHQ